MLNPGNYWARLTGGIAAKAKTGNAQMALRFTITHSATGKQESPWAELPDETERTMFLSLTDAAWPYTEPKLALLGFNGDFGDPAFDAKVMEEGVELVCKHEQYESKMRERWELVNWGSGWEPEPAAADVVRKLTARWKQAHGAKPAVKRPTPPAPSKAPAQPEDDASLPAEDPGGEDIPF